jgi:hypothetical protein
MQEGRWSDQCPTYFTQQSESPPDYGYSVTKGLYSRKHCGDKIIFSRFASSLNLLICYGLLFGLIPIYEITFTVFLLILSLT